jgi:hypothetical protein
MRRYLFNVLLAIDQLLTVPICAGEPDETMSSAAWRMEQTGHFWGFMRPVIDTLFWWDADHCRTSYEAEQQRRHLSDQFNQSKVTDQ